MSDADHPAAEIKAMQIVQVFMEQIDKIPDLDIEVRMLIQDRAFRKAYDTYQDLQIPTNPDLRRDAIIPPKASLTAVFKVNSADNFAGVSLQFGPDGKIIGDPVTVPAGSDDAWQAARAMYQNGGFDLDEHAAVVSKMHYGR